MSYALRSVGTNAVGVASTLSPGAPAGKASGDLLILYAVNRSNANTITTPAGWTIISPGSNVAWDVVYARIADGTAADTPTVTFVGTAGHVYACIAAFTGGPANLTSIVNAANDQNLPGNQTVVEYSTLPVTSNNCLVIAATTKNKTSTSDGTTFNAFSGMTVLDHFDGAPANGTNVSVYWGYQVQTTATTINSGTQTLTGTTETLQYTSILVALISSPTLAATNLAPYVYSLGNITFTTSQTGNPYLVCAPLNYNYALARSSSDFQLDASPIVYTYSISSAFLVRLPQDTFFAVNAIGYSYLLQDITFTVGSIIPPTGTFPNVVGLPLQMAEAALQASGALNPAALGYFGNWPINVVWQSAGTPAGTLMQPDYVVAQSPASGSVIVPNAPMVLTVIETPTSVGYPGTNPSINSPVN